MGSYPLSSQAPTHVEVELGCDNCESYSVSILMWQTYYDWTSYATAVELTEQISLLRLVLLSVSLDFYGSQSP